MNPIILYLQSVNLQKRMGKPPRQPKRTQKQRSSESTSASSDDYRMSSANASAANAGTSAANAGTSAANAGTSAANAGISDGTDAFRVHSNDEQKQQQQQQQQQQQHILPDPSYHVEPLSDAEARIAFFGEAYRLQAQLLDAEKERIRLEAVNEYIKNEQVKISLSKEEENFQLMQKKITDDITFLQKRIVALAPQIERSKKELTVYDQSSSVLMTKSTYGGQQHPLSTMNPQSFAVVQSHAMAILNNDRAKIQAPISQYSREINEAIEQKNHLEQSLIENKQRYDTRIKERAEWHQREEEYTRAKKIEDELREKVTQSIQMMLSMRLDNIDQMLRSSMRI